MKRKTIVWAYLIILSLGTILSLYIPKNEVTAKEAVTIPGEAIRLRILANSDLESDQALKRQVRDAVNAKISVWVKDLTSIKEARAVIKSKLPEIQATAEEVVKQQGSNQSVKIKFGKVQFPTKLYGEFLYPAGEYEAILITLGDGKGANWWCVLFPPLCFLDFSNGVAVSAGFEDKKSNSKQEEAKSVKQVTPAPVYTKDDEQPIKVKFFVVELWEKLFD
jgi:stage II sporulation protein R